MRSKLHIHISPAMLIALAALFVALGGPSQAVNSARTVFKAKNADKVDKLHASKKPKRGRLLALNKNGKFPASVFPFAPGQGPEGDRGATGARGPRGYTGPPGLSGLEHVVGTPVPYHSDPANGRSKATVSCPSGKYILSVHPANTSTEEGTAPPYVVTWGFGDDNGNLTGGSIVMAKPDSGKYGFSAGGLCAYASVEDGP